MKKKIKDLNYLVSHYLDYVNSYGNECAYTDRIVEEIIKTSKKIEKEYNKKWKSN